jgi:ABC-type multidrug transport system fused ATPase/permease subunit
VRFSAAGRRKESRLRRQHARIFRPYFLIMESVMQIAVVVVAAVGAAMTFVVSRQVLRDHSVFNRPDVLAACVAVMSFMGMLSAGPVIVIGFAALGFTCLALPFVRFLIDQGVFRSHDSSENPTTTSPRPRLPSRPTRAETVRVKAATPRKGVIPLDIMRRASSPRSGKDKSRRAGPAFPTATNNQ